MAEFSLLEKQLSALAAALSEADPKVRFDKSDLRRVSREWLCFVSRLHAGCLRQPRAHACPIGFPPVAHPPTAHPSSSWCKQGGLAPLTLVDDDLLEVLAAEIPDLRMRVGVSDVQVFGSNPFSVTKLRLQVRARHVNDYIRV